MRAGSSLVLAAAVALGGCSAIDDFGRFTVGGGDMGGCTPGCTCIPADPMLDVPEHCALAPSNGIDCSGAPRDADDVALTGGEYILNTGDPLSTSPPTLMGPGVGVTGNVAGLSAVFCIGSLVATMPSRLSVIGHRTLVIVADSVVRFTGTIALGGNYAIDDKGAPGTAGGTSGGDQTMPGNGLGGGKPGSGSPGTGGGGGGSTSPGAMGGAAMGGLPTDGGAGAMSNAVGFGGGGGGAGAAKGGGGGGGGGSLQISAGWAIAFDQTQVDASGGGGAGGEPSPATGQPAGGGGGGGGGGVLWLEAPMVGINGGCLSVIGGPGGGGGGGLRGTDAKPSAMCGFLGMPGVGGPSGGNGGGPGTAMPAGSAGTAGGGGGGGTGGFGRVTIRSHAPPATNPNVVPSQAYNPVVLP